MNNTLLLHFTLANTVLRLKSATWSRVRTQFRSKINPCVDYPKERLWKWQYQIRHWTSLNSIAGILLRAGKVRGDSLLQHSYQSNSINRLKAQLISKEQTQPHLENDSCRNALKSCKGICTAELFSPESIFLLHICLLHGVSIYSHSVHSALIVPCHSRNCAAWTPLQKILADHRRCKRKTFRFYYRHTHPLLSFSFKSRWAISSHHKRRWVLTTCAGNARKCCSPAVSRRSWETPGGSL